MGVGATHAGMRLSRLRAAAAAVPFAAALALAPAAAYASAATVPDPRGDAPASADATAVRYTNGLQRVRVAAHVRNLASGTDMTLVVNHAGPGRYILRTGGLGKGFLTFARGTDEHRVRGPEWTLRRYTGAKSLMVVTIPQRCFGKRAGAAYFKATMYQAGGTGTDVTARTYLTRG